MANIKRAFVIGTSALAGLIAITGTAYGINRHNYQVNLANAKEQIPAERTNLATLKTKIARLEPDADGFLPTSATQATINRYQKSLNSMKDSYVDFGIAQSDLKSPLSFVRLTKASLFQEVRGIQTAYDKEHSVNALFTSAAIVGNQVKAQPIKDAITQAQVAKVSQTALNGVKSHSKYAQSVTNLLKDASTQAIQMDTAKNLVNSLYVKGKVKSGVSLDAVNKAKSIVSQIRNASVKSQLLTKVATAYQVADKNAKSQATAQAKKSGGKVVKNSDGSYSVVSSTQTASSNASGASSNGGSPASSVSASGGSSGGGSSYSGSGSSYASSGSSGSNGSSYSGGGSSYSSGSTSSYASKPSSSSSKQGNTASRSGSSGSSHSSGSSSGGYSTTAGETNHGVTGNGGVQWGGGSFSLPSGVSTP